jgi:hypothetical protein
LGEKEQKPMPKSKNTLKGYTDVNKTNYTLVCGVRYTGTPNAIVLKERLHLKTCKTCALLKVKHTNVEYFSQLGHGSVKVGRHDKHFENKADAFAEQRSISRTHVTLLE